MTVLPKPKLTVDEFLVWAETQPDRWELIDGTPVAMAPERLIHGDLKYRVARALDEAIAKAGVPCRFVLDSVAVRIDTYRSYQPDALVYCGDRAADDTLEIPNPIVVVEILSPGNAMKDLRDKLQGYFLVPSIQHYSIVDPEKRLVIHHARYGDGSILTRSIGNGPIRFDPPGIELTVEAIFVSAQ